MKDLRKKLEIPKDALKSVNDFLLDENNPLINDLFSVIDKYGGINEINKKAEEASKLDNLVDIINKKNPDYVKDIEWLIDARDNHSFISVADYRRKILGDKISEMEFNEDYAVTLELSACQYFPFLIDIAKDAVENQKLMPGRIIRVRAMKEQEEDGDLPAMAAAMQIIGATWVETLDTKGTAPGPDGMPVNVHLGGPDTITGYFGGVGQPNDFAIKWIDEFLYYYTRYGIKQVLNVNPGTVLLGYFIHKLGINNEFKISVYMGNDNPYSCLWTLLTAKLFAREDGTSPLIGFNLANSVNNETIEMAAYIRKPFGFEDVVRLEHHIVETWKSIVRQPYDRRDELMELAKKVKNVSAKHEGANVFRINHLDRNDAVNSTAEALTKNGLTFIAARNLHYYE
ncbi:MAG: hypothetical protein ACTSR5_05045 [Promethearchaeota archaeon]